MTIPQKRGFAAMNREQQRAIASKGGRAAHRKGTAHEFSSEEARKAGYLGGKAISANRKHMAAIGRKGGQRANRGLDAQRNVQSLDRNGMSADVPTTLSFEEY
jgi:general stress protein YciG